MHHPIDFVTEVQTRGQVNVLFFAAMSPRRNRLHELLTKKKTAKVFGIPQTDCFSLKNKKQTMTTAWSCAQKGGNCSKVVAKSCTNQTLEKQADRFVARQDTSCTILQSPSQPLDANAYPVLYHFFYRTELEKGDSVYKPLLEHERFGTIET